MIAVRNLTKQYRDHKAVDNVSFDVRAGETLILLGTSGSGKTTTLKMINRLIEPTSGTITINGVDACKRSPHELRREIGYVIQETGLFPHYTIAENIALVPRVLNWDEQRIQTRVRELMNRLRLPETYLNAYPGQLSGGQRQRVGLARALAAQPSILLMDEPLGALDPVTRSHIRREFRQLDELRQKTIVMVTHDVQEAFELGDRVGLMDGGQMQQIGTPQDLLLRPATEFVRQFFADQWLPLQLHTFSLHDLSPYLPHEPTYHPETMLLPGPTRLAEALGHLSGAKSISFETNNQFVTVHLTTIWPALSQLLERQSA
ncbi:ATP-binding cassette domain-containing protein [Spirosoma sp. BT702]|uniref:ATP-binding cassette domain-containing protein n=1 Tax=Spirosoma profusum TaxID=2771354 RepID=A0A927AUJ3_9BACT|nr:ATP-binding cassette domain-containing protein [Spirosoma profusum]MBD2704607.1 ATP-binding cassette domain-containing protein [Spirosoma profusum]